jgi:hypothetical protein
MDVQYLVAETHGLSVVNFTATVGTFRERLIERGWYGSPTARTGWAALKLATLGDEGLGDAANFVQTRRAGERKTGIAQGCAGFLLQEYRDGVLQHRRRPSIANLAPSSADAIRVFPMVTRGGLRLDETISESGRPIGQDRAGPRRALRASNRPGR